MTNLSSLIPPQRSTRWLASVVAGLALLAPAAQAQTLTLQGTGGSNQANDVTAFVDKVEIVRVLDGVVMTGALANAGFEAPALGTGNFVYRPTGATWTFSGNTGISSNGGGFSPPAIQEGSQTALIQTNIPSFISQPLTLAAGTYRVRFLATQRTCCSGVYDQGLTVTVGGVQVGATTPPVGGFVSYTSNAFTVNGSGNVISNNALAFDASDDLVAINTQPGVSNLNATGYTMEAWVNMNATTGPVNSIIRKDGDYNLYVFNGYVRTQIWQGSTLVETTSSTPVLTAGRWSHIAGTWNGTNLKVYVDGVDVTGGTNAYTLNVSSPLQLGRSTIFNEPLNGRLDEVRIYNTPLTLAQVRADMFSTTAAVPANLQLYYNFDQGTAGGNNAGLTTLTDQSGKGNTGTLTNFALTGTASNWVRSFPTITGISPTSGAAGSSVTVTGTNLLDANGFKFNTAAVAPFTTPTDDSFTTLVVPTSASTGPVSVSSATLTKYNGPVFNFLAGDLVVSTTMTIPPATYNNITVTGTGNGTLGGDVVVNGALVVQNGGALSDGCNIFTGSGTFTLAAGGTLSICRPFGILAAGDPLGNIGTVRVTGGRSFSSDANYVYNGSDATGSGLPSQVRNLSITVPGNVALSAPTSVTQALTLSSTGNLVLGSNALTLLSSASGTAVVVNSSTGVVNGTATVQRYIGPSLYSGAGYRHFSSPVANTTVGDLATASFSPEVSQANTYNNSATPGTTTPFPTVFGYDQSRVTLTNNYTPFDRGYVVPASTAAPLAVGQGYAVNIAANQLVDFNGTLNNGPITLPLSRVAANIDAGWQLLGNPYPAPLDYSLVAPADRINLDGAIYVYSSTGQYVGQYRSYVNGVGGNPVLPVAQGFFARVSAGQTSGSLTFRNSQRLTAPDATAFQRTAVDSRPLVQLELRGSTGPADALYAYAQAGATSAFDSQFDAVKMANPTGLNLSSNATSGEALSIDGRAVFAAATVLPLNVGVPAAGTYSLSAVALNNLPAGLDAYLRDAQTGQMVNLRTQPSYTFSVTAAQATALLTGRFTLQFASSALATTLGLTAAEVLLYPNPAHNAFAVQLPGVAGATTVQAELLNALGQVVRRQSANLPAAGTTLQVEAAGLPAGVYTLRLQAGQVSLAKRVVLN